jgi:acyl carrier protein
MPSNDLTIDIMGYIKEYLTLNATKIDMKLDSTTDLVSAGVDSIVILGIVAMLEKKLGKTIDMKKLESHEYKISANTLSSSFS